jgi:hypothetical protein
MMKKRWHHYLKWEDYQNGMYETFSGDKKKEFHAKAIEFTGNPELYGNAMLEVVERWPICCEQNLSDTGMNRQAWIGHAAACLAIGCPEEITRDAWSSLTQEQQDKANAKADLAIALWEAIYGAEDSKLHKEMGTTRIPGRYTG